MSNIEHIAEWDVIGIIENENAGVIIGYCQDSPTPYATWINTGNGDYHTGRYFVEKERAILDFCSRAKLWI